MLRIPHVWSAVYLKGGFLILFSCMLIVCFNSINRYNKDINFAVCRVQKDREEGWGERKKKERKLWV